MTRLVLLLALLLLACPAAAAPSRFDTLLAEGERLTKQGKPECAAAVEGALALVVVAADASYTRAQGALGLCREVRGEHAAAHTLISHALEKAPAETTPAGRKAPWPTLRAALRRLDDRVARALVTWTRGDLYLDGTRQVVVSGAVVALDPGSHVFEARDGKATVRRQIEVRAGDLPSVHLDVPEVKPPPEPFVIRLPPPEPIARNVTIGIAALAGVVAVGSLAATIGLEVERGKLRGQVAPGECAVPTTATCVALRDSFEERNTARTVAAVAFGAAVVAGGVAFGLHVARDKMARGSAVVTVGGLW